MTEEVFAASASRNPYLFTGAAGLIDGLGALG
jgi:hypothetical protein